MSGKILSTCFLDRKSSDEHVTLQEQSVLSSRSPQSQLIQGDYLEYVYIWRFSISTWPENTAVLFWYLVKKWRKCT